MLKLLRDCFNTHRFQYLISVNLADNDLKIIPTIIYQLLLLIDLTLASNETLFYSIRKRQTRKFNSNRIACFSLCKNEDERKIFVSQGFLIYEIS